MCEGLNIENISYLQEDIEIPDSEVEINHL